MLAVTPLMDSLIVYVSVWFWQEGREATFNAKLDGRGMGVIGTAGAPKVKRRSLNMQLTNPSDDRRHWNPLGAGRANQRVINIHKYDALSHVTPNA